MQTNTTAGIDRANEDVATISSAMPASAIIALLAEHQCFDITDRLDLARCERTPISNGGFGDIYRGALNGGEKVAIKCARLYLQQSDTKGHKVLKHSARELHTWSRLEHENVLELFGLAQFRDHMAMVSPWMDNGTLLEYTKSNPTADRHQLCMGISEGVAYLHQNNVIHGDIKSANVLISNQGVTKLADFGCSELKTSKLCFTTTSVLKLSIRWAAPEILDSSVSRSKEGDVYALGMTLLEVVTGAVPFSDLTDRAVYIAVVMQQRIPKRPRRFPSFTPYEAAQLWGIVVDSCAHSSSDRPGSIEIRDHLRDIRQHPVQPISDNLVIDSGSSDMAHEANRPWTPPTLPDGDERDDEYAEYAEYDEYDEYDEYGEYEDGEDGEDYESDEEGLVQPNSNTTPVVDPYANVQSGTIAYAKSESPDGVATYTPVVAQETFYQTSSGRTRGIKWVKATPSQAMAAGIPSEAITTNNAAELPRPTGISIPPISFLRERRLSVSSVASPGSNRHNDLTPEPWLDPDNPRLGRPNTAADDAAMMAHVRALEEARKLVKGEIDQEDEESMQRPARSARHCIRHRPAGGFWPGPA